MNIKSGQKYIKTKFNIGDFRKKGIEWIVLKIAVNKH